MKSGTGLSAGGTVWVRFQNLQVAAETLAHELGHTFGLSHTGAIPSACNTEHWDGPFVKSDTGFNSVCALMTSMDDYQDLPNIMGQISKLDTSDLNGHQKYLLGLIQPGAGLIQATATPNEQTFVIHDTHTPDTGLPQAIRLTADAPAGSVSCVAPVYNIEYDPALGGVRIFHVVQRNECHNENLDPLGSGPDTISWMVPLSFYESRQFFLPGESQVTSTGKVQIKVVSADPATGTATVKISRTDTPGLSSLQVTSRTLAANSSVAATGDLLAGLVTTNQASWSASSDQSWATVTTSGTTGQYLAVSVPPNTTALQRTATVTVRAGTETRTYTVVQDAGDASLASDCGAALTSYCTWSDLNTQLNGTFEAKSERDWYKLTAPAAGTYQFYATKSSSSKVMSVDMVATDGRTTTIASRYPASSLEIYLDAGQTCFLQLTALGPGDYTMTATYDPAGIATSTDYLWVPPGESRQTVTIRASGDWELPGASPYSWTTASPAAGTGDTVVELTIQPNDVLRFRSKTMSFTSGGKTATIKVYQPVGTAGTLTVDPTSVSAPAGGDSKTVQVTASGSWTATGPDWVTVSPPSWTGATPVTVTIKPNTGTQTRTDNVTFKSGDLTASLAVRQDAPVIPLAVSPTSVTFTSAGNSKDVQVTGSGSWTATGPDWVTISPPSGSGDTRVTVTAKPNTGTQTRTDNVTFKSGNQTAQLAVSQDPPPQDILTVTPPSLYAAPAGDTQTVEVSASGDWEVSTPSWVTASPRTGSGNTSVRLTTTANTTGQARTETITFTTATKTASVTIRQDAPVIPLAVSPTSATFTSAGNSKDVQVTGSGSWTATGPDWVTISPPSGSGDTRVTVTAKPNTGTQTRTDNVTFKSGNQTVQLGISQTAALSPDSVTPDSVSAAAEGGTYSLQINTSWNWQIKTSGAVSVSRTSGTGDTSIELTMPPNTTMQPRSAYVDVTFWFANGYKTVPVPITQPALRDDCGAEAYTACTWASLNAAAAGTLDYDGDKDWHKFTAPVTGTYTFTASQTATQPVRNTAGTLYANYGSTVVASDSSSAYGYQFKITASLTAGQTYYLQVTGTGTGNYTVSGTAPDGGSVSVAVSSFTPPGEGGSRLVYVTANGSWQVKAPDWISLDRTSGFGNGTVLLTATPNTTGSPRIGQVVFTSANQTAVLWANQGPQSATPIMTVSQTAFDCQPTGCGTMFRVYSNSAWQATTSEPWIILYPRAYSSDQWLTVQPNTTGATRTGWITVAAAGQVVLVLVTQKG